MKEKHPLKKKQQTDFSSKSIFYQFRNKFDVTSHVLLLNRLHNATCSTCSLFVQIRDNGTIMKDCDLLIDFR